MTDVDNLVLEHLRAIRADMADLKERMTNLEIRMSAIEQQLSGLTVAVYAGHNRLQDLQHRVERIERRLDLRDEATP
jgi:uncharacterized coiled-coil protein SlyX